MAPHQAAGIAINAADIGTKSDLTFSTYDAPIELLREMRFSGRPYVSGLQPSVGWWDAYLGLRPRLVYGAPLALSATVHPPWPLIQIEVAQEALGQRSFPWPS